MIGVRACAKARCIPAALLISLMMCCGTAYAGAAGSGSRMLLMPLHVSGTQLMTSDNEPVLLRGISTHGLAWYPQYVNAELFQELHDDWNVNVIRLAMYTAESGGYCTDGDREQLKTLIDEGIRYATEAGLYVIVDWHILSDHDPNLHREEAIAFFSEMSERYADHSNILYEICNEPNGPTTWQEVKSYALSVIPAIRAHDPDAVILIGTPNWSQMVDQAAADPITGYDNLMYVLHFYAATHKQDLRDRMSGAIDAGLPVFVSEYGICDASGSGDLDLAEANAWVKLLNEKGVSYVAWNMSNKNESSAILQTSCEKTSHLSADDLSDSGKWLFGMLTGEELSVFDAADAPEAENAAGMAEAGIVRMSEDGLKVQAVLRSQWEEEGAEVLLYDLTVTNTSEAEKTSWSAALPFAQDFVLLDSWNADCEQNGKVLTITPKDYNRQIPAGGSVSDIGFIVKGSGGIQP